MRLIPAVSNSAGWRWRGALLIALVLVLSVFLYLKLPTRTAASPSIDSASGVATFHPRSSSAVLGVPYRLKIYTHCGLASWASPDFDGSFWDPVGPNDDGNGNPPAGVGNPFDQGTMVLVSRNRAQFTSRTGATFLFTRHVGDKGFAPCW